MGTGIDLLYLIICTLGGLALSGWRIEGLLLGSLAYWFLAILRRLLTRSQRRGSRLLKAHRIEEALAQFRKSEEFWNHHKLLERYRMLLGYANRKPFFEMALYNQASCLIQLGQLENALAVTNRLIEEGLTDEMALELKTVLEKELRGKDDARSSRE